MNAQPKESRLVKQVVLFSLRSRQARMHWVAGRNRLAVAIRFVKLADGSKLKAVIGHQRVDVRVKKPESECRVRAAKQFPWGRAGRFPVVLSGLRLAPV